MKRPFRWLVVGLVGMVGLGCLNPFTNTYQAVLTGNNYKQELERGDVRLIRTDNADAELQRYLSKPAEWVLVGNSSWTGQDWLDDQATEQARSVGAVIAIVQSRQLNSQMAYMPMSTPTATTTTSSGSVGYGGARGNYSGYSTTYGVGTTYIPFERVTMRVKAYFVGRYKPSPSGVKTPPPIAAESQSSPLGVAVRSMQLGDQQIAGTKTGAFILSVAQGSEAARVGLEPGDVIVQMGDTPVQGEMTFGIALGKNLGKSTEIEFVRRGKTIRRTVKLGGESSPK